MTRSSLDKSFPTPVFEVYANPMAGQELHVIAPQYRLSALVQLSFLFTADANAANRLIYLTLEYSLQTWRVGSTAINITANQVWHIICHPNAQINTVNNIQDLFISTPQEPIWSFTHDLWARVTNKQATDQISDASAIWQCYPVNVF